MDRLDVKNLKTHFFTSSGTSKAVDDVSFEVKRRQVLGIAGESGSGKSTTALSIVRLVPPPGKIIGGEVCLDGENLLKKTESEMRSYVRWSRISMVLQGAMNALNPVFRVSDQIVEGILAHSNESKVFARQKAEELLEMVSINSTRADDYPHELSGGMKQRVTIAMALACDPDLLILDEPTSALDVYIQAGLLKLIKSLQEKKSLSTILITHDLAVISKICDSITIMYCGKIVEYTDVPTFFRNAKHPYSQGLIASIPKIKGPKRRVEPIPGIPPNPKNPPSGCRFYPRCKYAKEKCRKDEPKLVEVSRGHFVACHFIDS